MDMNDLVGGNLGLRGVPRKRQKNIFTWLDLNELLVLFKTEETPKEIRLGIVDTKLPS